MSNFIRHYDEHFGPKLARRINTFRNVLHTAIEMDVKTIVEVGTMRLADNWAGDGQSTLIWEAYAKAYGGKVITIDIDQEATTLAAGATNYDFVKCICGDSVATLNGMTESIDLLYLDGSDLDQTNSHPAAMTCLMELAAAMPKLHKDSIVFIDDTGELCGKIIGKGEYVADYMRRIGLRPFTIEAQAAWLLP